MSWQHRAFLSYERHDADVANWVHTRLRPPLLRFLKQDHGWRFDPTHDTPDLWYDQDPRAIPLGEPYPDKLKHAVAHTLLLVPVLGCGYFQRDWCCWEFENVRSRANPIHLCPVWIGDGEHFPDGVDLEQAADLRDDYRWRPQRQKKATLRVIEQLAETLHDRWKSGIPFNPAWTVSAPPIARRHPISRPLISGGER